MLRRAILPLLLLCASAVWIVWHYSDLALVEPEISFTLNQPSRRLGSGVEFLATVENLSNVPLCVEVSPRGIGLSLLSLDGEVEFYDPEEPEPGIGYPEDGWPPLGEYHWIGVAPKQSVQILSFVKRPRAVRALNSESEDGLIAVLDDDFFRALGSVYVQFCAEIDANDPRKRGYLFPIGPSEPFSFSVH